MRWFLILVLCATTRATFACPQLDFPKLATGGQVLETRKQTVDGYEVETSLRRLPPRPRVYLHLDQGNTEMPEFRRPDGSKISYTVEPTGNIGFEMVLTLAIDHGRIESADYTRDQFVIDEGFAPTTRDVELGRFVGDGVWEWSIDSDAAVFRIGRWYTTEGSKLWLYSEDSLVAIYPDGREEVLLGWPRPLPSEPEPSNPWWWLVFGVPVVAWWIGRRAARSLVAEI